MSFQPRELHVSIICVGACPCLPWELALSVTYITKKIPTLVQIRRHARKVQERSDTRKNSILRAFSLAGGGANVGIPSANKEILYKARALLFATLVSKGVNPNIQDEIFNPGSGSTVFRVISTLRKRMNAVLTRGTNEQDSKLAYDTLKNFITSKVKDEYGSIVTDGASFRRTKVVAVMFSTQALPQPVLLRLVFPAKEYADDNDECPAVYDATRAASDIADALSEYGIQSKNVASLVGDNVEFNDALARTLHVNRAKCLPHALNLVIKHGVKQIPYAVDLIQRAGSIIYHGGTTKRADELKSLGLNPRQMQMYPNRFGSAVSCASYRFANFDQVKKWQTTSTNLPVDDFDYEQEEGEDEVSPGTAAMKAKAAYLRETAKLTLCIVVHLYDEVRGLLAACEGEFDSIPENIITKMELRRNVFALIEESPKDYIAERYRKNPGAFPQESLASAQAELSPFVAAAMRKSMASWDKHVAPALLLLRNRFHFNPRVEPVAPSDSSSSVFESPLCPVVVDSVMTVAAQYQAYTAEYKATKESEGGERKIHERKHYTYWKAKTDIWPELSKIALWWGEIPTSSIACERAFSMLRLMETPTRNRQRDETVNRELCFRVNSNLLDSMLSAAGDQVNNIPIGADE